MLEMCVLSAIHAQGSRAALQDTYSLSLIGRMKGMHCQQAFSSFKIQNFKWGDTAEVYYTLACHLSAHLTQQWFNFVSVFH